MKLQAWGVNHKTAKIDLRERLAFSENELKGTYDTLNKHGFEEAMILSTCNRTEVYTVASKKTTDLSHVIGQIKAISPEDIAPYAQEFEDLEVAAHLFKVVSSLDSMVIGEPEIVSQVKQAYQAARQHNSTGKVLNNLSQRAFNVAKRIRTETEICSKPTSVGAVAATLAIQIFGQQGAQTIAIMGAGEMAEVSLNNLKGRIGNCEVIVCNRSIEHAESLATKFNGTALPLSETTQTLIKADIVISSLSVKRPIIDLNGVREVLPHREGRPLFIIDLGVPRNVSEEIGQLSDVFLYDMDALQRHADNNLKYREQLLSSCQPYIDEGVEDFMLWTHSLDHQEVISDVMKRNRDLIESELQKSLKKIGHLNEDETAEIRYLVNRVLKKALHHPIHNLRNSQLNRPGPITSWRQFFFGD